MKYFARRKKAKLYRQWVEQAGLPPDAIPLETQKPEDTQPQGIAPESVKPVSEDLPTIYVRAGNGVATHPDVTGDMLAEIKKIQRRIPVLYILLGVSMVIFFTALILLIVWSC